MSRPQHLYLGADTCEIGAGGCASAHMWKRSICNMIIAPTQSPLDTCGRLVSWQAQKILQDHVMFHISSQLKLEK